MITRRISPESSAGRASIVIALALFGASVPFAVAQSSNGPTNSSDAMLTLPDAPGAMIASTSAATPDNTVLQTRRLIPPQRHLQ